MGGASSKSTIDVRTKSIVEALTQNIMDCQSNTIVDQRFVLSGSYNTIENFKMVQYLRLSKDCINNAQNLNDIQQSVSNAIKQSAEAQSVSLLGVLGNSDSEANTFIDNEVRQTITNQNITKMIDKVNASQEAIISGDNNIIRNFSMEQTADVVMKAAQEVLNSLKSVQEIKNQVSSESKATQTNFISDIIDSVTGLFTGVGMIWALIAVVAIAVGGWVLVKSNPFSKSDEKTIVMGPPQQQPYGMPQQQQPYGMQPQQQPYGMQPITQQQLMNNARQSAREFYQRMGFAPPQPK